MDERERDLRKDLLLLRAALRIRERAPVLARAARVRQRTYAGYASGGYGPWPEWGRGVRDAAQYFLIPCDDRVPPDQTVVTLIPRAVDIGWVQSRCWEHEFWEAQEFQDTMGGPEESAERAGEARRAAERWEAVQRRIEGEITHLTASVAAACLARDRARKKMSA